MPPSVRLPPAPSAVSSLALSVSDIPPKDNVSVLGPIPGEKLLFGNGVLNPETRPGGQGNRAQIPLAQTQSLSLALDPWISGSLSS